MAQILDGKQMAAQVEEELLPRISRLRESGVVPTLTVILAGEDPASKTYVANKEKACARLGICSKTLRFPETVTQEELENAVKEENEDPQVHGILVQLPLPRGLEESRILRLISPKKDVDGFHPVNQGLLLTGQECFVPCTPKGILRMLAFAGISPQGKKAVVVGRSNIVGKPAALLLLSQNATVTVCHSRTENLAEITRQADILVAAVGKPGLIGADMVKPGAAVIDVGINRVEGKLKGDVDFENVEPIAGSLTPVPGGVGKMTIAMLMENTVEAAERASRA